MWFCAVFRSAQQDKNCKHWQDTLPQSLPRGGGGGYANRWVLKSLWHRHWMSPGFFINLFPSPDFLSNLVPSVIREPWRADGTGNEVGFSPTGDMRWTLTVFQCTSDTIHTYTFPSLTLLSQSLSFPYNPYTSLMFIIAPLQSLSLLYTLCPPFMCFTSPLQFISLLYTPPRAGGEYSHT